MAFAIEYDRGDLSFELSADYYLWKMYIVIKFNIKILFRNNVEMNN